MIRSRRSETVAGKAAAGTHTAAALRRLALGCAMLGPAVAAAQPQAMRTFDCRADATPLFRLLCRNAAAARADWELNAAANAHAYAAPVPPRAPVARVLEAWQTAVLRRCKLRERSPPDGRAAACVIAAFRARAAELVADLPPEARDEAALSPAQRARIQEALIALGYLRGVADGQFGADTRAAILRFHSGRRGPAAAFLNAEQRDYLLSYGAAGGTQAAPEPAVAAAEPDAPTGTLAPAAHAPAAAPAAAAAGERGSPVPAATVTAAAAPETATPRQQAAAAIASPVDAGASPPPDGTPPAAANPSADAAASEPPAAKPAAVADAAGPERGVPSGLAAASDMDAAPAALVQGGAEAGQPAAPALPAAAMADAKAPDAAALQRLREELRREIRVRNFVIGSLIAVCASLCLVGILAARLRRASRRLHGAG